MRPIQSGTSSGLWNSSGELGAVPSESVENIKSIKKTVTDAPSIQTAENVKAKAPSGQYASQITEAKLQGDARAVELHDRLNRITDVIDGTSSTVKHEIRESMEGSKFVRHGQPGIVTDNKDPDKLYTSAKIESDSQAAVLTELEEFATTVVPRPMSESEAAQARRPHKDKRAKDDDDGSSQIAPGWDVRQPKD
ncbi:hypothetical protein L0156_00915 [bacterium]|nr:hypothetical protein [bacterium]